MPIDWLTLGAAALAGLLGGAHCAAMCGGIATGLQAASARPGLASALQVNLGRIGGYVLAGAIAGGLGQAIVQVARLQGLALAARMLVGVVLVVAAMRLWGKLPWLARAESGLWTWLRPLQRRLLPLDGVGKRVAAGMLWGWLPCGLSTTMLAAAWLQASAQNGALTMAAFGLSTLLVMLPLTWSGARLGRWLHDPRRRGAGVALLMLAGLLTLASPWLVHAPGMPALLAALGCLPTPT